MNFPLIFTALILIVLTLILIREWLAPEIAVFSALILLVVGRVVTVEEAFSGFSNIGVLTIGMLFVVAGSLQSSGALSYLYPLIFGGGNSSFPKQLARTLFPISAVSAFVNNTPIVSMLIPAVKSWTEKHDISASKLLIPVSYAAILGGMCTLIGTSTNLIVHGLLIENGRPGLGFFEISWIGVPAALAGLLFLVAFGHSLLPDRKEPMVELGETTREFVIELKVNRNYQNVGRTVEEAGLRHLKGLFLFQIERGGRIIAPARPEERIQVGDRLFFTGLPKTIIELQKTPGLQLIKESQFDLKQYDSDLIKPYEAVISPSSPLVGKNVRESNFRGRYGAVILAIHRNGERIQKKIGDIVLHAGDTLLLLAERDFIRKWYHSRDFLLISHADEVPSKPQWRAKLSIAIFLGMILLTVLHVLPLISAAGLAAILVVVSGAISPGDAKQAVDWKVLLIIASALGIARAIQNSGLSDTVAGEIIAVGHIGGPLGVLVALYLLTSLYNAVITSNATAALIFPIALSVGLAAGGDARPFVLAITIAAAASFATPISYQTNLMVYGPGGYRFADFLKVGIPLQILVGAVAIAMIWVIYF